MTAIPSRSFAVPKSRRARTYWIKDHQSSPISTTTKSSGNATAIGARTHDDWTDGRQAQLPAREGLPGQGEARGEQDPVFQPSKGTNRGVPDELRLRSIGRGLHTRGVFDASEIVHRPRPPRSSEWASTSSQTPASGEGCPCLFERGRPAHAGKLSSPVLGPSHTWPYFCRTTKVSPWATDGRPSGAAHER
jgi:hypothetical protein